MALSDIAAGVEVTDEQRNRGVATVDDTDAELDERLARHESDLPCDAAAAATVVETHTAGRSVGQSARSAGVTPVTAAKVLHLLGVAGVCPLGPTGREIVQDWLVGGISRSDALALSGASETEFAIAAFVESHDPIDDAAAAVEGVLTPDESTVSKHNQLADTMSDANSLR